MDIPCKDCICFPICKAQVCEFIDSCKKSPIANKLFLAYRDVLIKKCTIIYKWMDDEYNANGGIQGVHYGFIILQMSTIYKCEFKGDTYDK